MAASEKDVVPMLSATDSQTDESDDSRYRRRFSSSARSASLSIPANSMDSYYTENALLGFTGPLRNERRTPLVQMSGPLYVSHKPESNLRPSQVTLGRKPAGPTMEKYPSVAGRESNRWANDDYFGKNEHLLRSGQLGMCNDPYCTTCPAIDILNAQKKKSKSPEIYDHKFHNMIYGDAKGWAKKICSFLSSRIPGVMNPHTKVVQRWNKFFVISCLFAVFIDPLFFFLLTVNQDKKCIVLNWPLTTTIVILRSFTDFIYLIHMLLQFRLAYVAPESRVVGAGDLVDHPKKIALNYLKGYFFIDFFIVLPFPQIIILLILPRSLSGANFAKNLLRAAILVQYVPRLFRFLPLIAGQSSSGFIFESAWANFVINLLTFVLAGHVVGSCWYLLGLQRVNQCLRDACHDSKIANCREFIDCGHSYNFRQFSDHPSWHNWTTNVNATACLNKDYKDGYYGIYGQAVNLTTKPSIVTRYVYSLFWGFQQISTLAGNQVPSYFEWEVLFTMGIIGLGLLLFALLIGNMQNFLQSLGRRQLEMSLRRRDVEQWMSHRRLSDDLRRRVRQAERYTWAATRGVNEERLLENLPEDIQRDIRRHLFKFVKKVHIFALLDEPILDAICERLRQKTYIKGSRVLYQGGLIDKMVFIIRGNMESIGEDGNASILSEGDACGEELLTWCLEHSSVNKDGRKIRIPGPRLLSNRGVECLTNVEAFILRAADIEEVTSLFARFLRSPRVQGAIRYASPYWRGRAARCIQVAWRYRKKRQSRADGASPQHSLRDENLFINL
ncbi:PREDICTED: probable cyclic nucleotide-gated ion channel 20, chloroplastic isoform X2 [Ipomoea nil]|uniref:probable cyclic nucleotide-gated ion channel 20, chloroplastic isoform X2 n=1 Tax=Ipomoea nil TaxID=35883 RepID=UPI000901B0A3|nr:PREDICTED: probable cyclic nucleotide-gated ion channel 20, chloroplastic isoform X2 [Ipomoea nil]